VTTREKSERRMKIEAQILKLTRSKFLQLGEIAEALNMPKNTVRSKYLYPMVAEGLLQQQFPHRTSQQAYKAR
jgi:DNA-binding IclR family transcriptional regulator